MGPSIMLTQTAGIADATVEVVERKGIGHPDTLADALAERMSVAYSQLCRDSYGAVLHHNLDKLYLRGGQARTGLGEHDMTEPTVLVIGGRVSSSFAGQDIPYRDLFEQVALDYLGTVLPAFDAAKWLRVEHVTTNRSRFPTWFQPRSLDDLPELSRPTSSDTVAVTSWWPHSPTEQLVLALERHLNQEGTGPRYTHLGQDIKIMAYRRLGRVNVVANVAVHPNAAPTDGAYETVITELWNELSQVAEKTCPQLDIVLRINTQETNPYAAKKHYLLGSGSCLEFGEEGFVGRGNGVSGLIPLQRPKSVEAAFGKNPTYHAGKVYTIYAAEIARTVHDQLGIGATVTIVAANSNRLREPSHVIVDTDQPGDAKPINSIVADVLNNTDHLSLAVDHGCIIPR